MTDAPQISLLVPFRADHKFPNRLASWRWLAEYWSHELPDAEVVIGHSRAKVFSKTSAVNDAVAHSHGRVLVILDSDCYIAGPVIQHCADAIDAAVRRRIPLWFIPFRSLYRLTEMTTKQILASDPAHPLRLPSPPSHFQIDSVNGPSYGHHFGAMIQILPREAFELVGGMDPRFAGWGGEDVAFVRAVDTLYGQHKTTKNDVLHLWHPNFGTSFKTRMWEGQLVPRSNERLAQRYNKATGDRVRMRALVQEGIDSLPRPRWWRRFITWL